MCISIENIRIALTTSVAISADLRLDAERDLMDIGGAGIEVIDGCKMLEKSKGVFVSGLKSGVVFSTYSTLIRSCQVRGSKEKKSRRIDQLIDWVGGADFEGLLVFDECHKAKNFKDGDGGTKVGAAVVELQNALPRARIMYCSATGVTDLVS